MSRLASKTVFVGFIATCNVPRAMPSVEMGRTSHHQVAILP
jgi:hypothetical protein